jgi:hypothetical protein
VGSIRVFSNAEGVTQTAGGIGPVISRSIHCSHFSQSIKLPELAKSLGHCDVCCSSYMGKRRCRRLDFRLTVGRYPTDFQCKAKLPMGPAGGTIRGNSTMPKLLKILERLSDSQ